MKRLWVVEMFNPYYANIKPRWEPTVGCGLTRESAKEEARQWHKRNPEDRFRVRCYVNREDR